MTASAEPSTSSSALVIPSNTAQVFKQSNSDPHDQHKAFQPEAIVKQSDIIASTWPHTTAEAKAQFPEFCALYERIRSFNLPNFLGARVPLETKLHLQVWREKLVSYHDKDICIFLEFGWPVGYHSSTPPISCSKNHPSATLHPTHVNKFITTELAHGALVGPFTSSPFTPWTRCSPIMTRPKKDSSDRRVIIDLSFPHGEAVNDGINSEDFFGSDISYSLPVIGDLVALIQHHGKGTYLWKADLARAYRQFRIDPLDTPLLGISFDSAVYLDLCPSFGCRTSSAVCQRVSNALAFILAKQGHTILAYLDDYASCHASYHQAVLGYRTFLSTAEDLGLDLASHKCIPPTHVIEWLGYTIDSVNMTVSIPNTKMDEFVKDCGNWVNKRRASKTAIQSLAGKMNFIANCVTQGRRFMSRVLAAIRTMGNREWTTLSDGFRLDVKWFITYAKNANGVSLISPVRPEVEFECDSSTTGGGGVASNWCYFWRYSESHVEKYHKIHELEAINTVVAYRTFSARVARPGAHVTIHTDNSSSAFALESGRTKDLTLAACARELWLIAACQDQTVSIRHKAGALIPLSDALSRVHEDRAKAAYAKARIQHEHLQLVPPVLNNYVFFTHDL